MSHWAEVDADNKVIRVLVGDNNDPAGDEGYEWLVDNLGGTWIQTSYNNRTRFNYAGIGYTWDGIGFAAPQPYPSWTLNADSYLWEAPTPMPTDDKRYTWDESTLTWTEITL
jgi:hypothetical protein